MARDYPNSPTEGTLSIPTNPTGGAAIYRYTSGKFVKNGGGSATAQRRNRMINPSHMSSIIANQLVDSTVTGTNFYASDGYVIGNAGVNVLRYQKVESWTPRGSKYRIRATVNTADTSLTSTDTAYFGYSQLNEGNEFSDFQYGTAAAKYSVMRFGFRAPAGTYSLSLRNGAAAVSFVSVFTVTAGQANTDQEWTFIIPPCTTGTWVTTTGYFVWFFITFANASSTGTLNAWQTANVVAGTGGTNGVATVGNVFELFDVGWYLDPLTTGIAPDFQQNYFEDDLKAIQRHWVKVQGSCGIGTAATTSVRFTQPPPVPLHVVPVMSQSSAGYIWYYNSGGSKQVTTQATGTLTTQNMIDVSLTATTAAMTVGIPIEVGAITGMTDYNFGPSILADAR